MTQIDIDGDAACELPWRGQQEQAQEQTQTQAQTRKGPFCG
jgi:hypothetical protein